MQPIKSDCFCAQRTISARSPHAASSEAGRFASREAVPPRSSFFFACALLLGLLCPLQTMAAEDAGITWLVEYDGAALPDSAWTVTGKPNAKIEARSLHLIDD